MYRSHYVPEACVPGSDRAYLAGVAQGLACFAAVWWLTRRADPSGSARWRTASAPGGELEITEQEVEAAARRILESKGVSLRVYPEHRFGPEDAQNGAPPDDGAGTHHRDHDIVPLDPKVYAETGPRADWGGA